MMMMIMMMMIIIIIIIIIDIKTIRFGQVLINSGEQTSLLANSNISETCCLSVTPSRRSFRLRLQTDASSVVFSRSENNVC